jgi:hypothetical protein
LRYQARGDGGEDHVFIHTHPVIAAWWLAQAIGPVLTDDVTIRVVGARQAITVAPGTIPIAMRLVVLVPVALVVVPVVSVVSIVSMPLASAVVPVVVADVATMDVLLIVILAIVVVTTVIMLAMVGRALICLHSRCDAANEYARQSCSNQVSHLVSPSRFCPGWRHYEASFLITN